MSTHIWYLWRQYADMPVGLLYYRRVILNWVQTLLTHISYLFLGGCCRFRPIMHCPPRKLFLLGYAFVQSYLRCSLLSILSPSQPMGLYGELVRFLTMIVGIWPYIILSLSSDHEQVPCVFHSVTWLPDMDVSLLSVSLKFWMLGNEVYIFTDAVLYFGARLWQVCCKKLYQTANIAAFMI